MPKRYRAVLRWVPEWNANIEKWTSYQIKKNMWRFDWVDDFEDLMQQARILFWELSKRYPNVTEPGHFFALYKTSLLRRFVDKSRIRSKSPVDPNMDVETYLTVREIEGDLPNMGTLNKLLEEMPDDLKSVLRALTTGRVRRTLDRPPTTSKRLRENHNMRLKRQLNLTSDDPVGDLRSYILNT